MPKTANNSQNNTSAASFNDVYTLVADDLRAVNTVIEQQLRSDVALINQLGYYIINSGGKRLRPILLLLCNKAFGTPNEQHIPLAAIIEFIHTATLLHDDVVDASAKRRGQDTANNIWGNEASVLVGDFLYSRAFQMMVKLNSMSIMDILADATNTIAEGEVLQLLNCNDPDTTEQRYLDVIQLKTAKLFEAAAQLGAVINNATESQTRAMTKFGMHLGTAFQLIDDVLDYSSSAEEMGKNIGDDLAEGKPTLPLIRAMTVGTAKQSECIRNAIKLGGRDNIHEVTAAIESTDALAYTDGKAREESEKAIKLLDCLPSSASKTALTSLAEFSVNRSF